MSKTIRNALVVAAAVATLAAAPVAARPLVEVTLLDRSLNREIPIYRHDGQMYAPGEAGHRYAIRLHNRSGERVLAVVSVDGVNIVTGETAHPSQSGYVLEPWQSTELTGWRKSMAQVAAFQFAPLPESYAARTGRPNDVGVIGVAVFTEQRYFPTPAPTQPPVIGRDKRHAEELAGAPAASAPESADKARAQSSTPLGTGHGERERSLARNTQFQRSSRNPVQVSTIYYDSRRNLIAAGVLPGPRPRHYAGGPRAFPGFVPDPPRR